MGHLEVSQFALGVGAHSRIGERLGIDVALEAYKGAQFLAQTLVRDANYLWKNYIY